MNYFNPLDSEEEDALEDLYKSAPMGRDRLYDLFKKQYPDMTVSRRAVFDFLTKQEVHQIHQKPVVTKGVVRPVTSAKKGSCQLDCIKLPKFNGMDTALTLIDTFTKKLFVAPLRTQTADEVVKGLQSFLDKGLYCKFINTDNGTEFLGAFPDFCKKNGIILYKVRPHSPWANGQVERVNGTFKRFLFQSMKLKNTTDWISLTPIIVNNYNNSINRATNKSPNEIEQKYDSVRQEVGTHILNKAKGRYTHKTVDNVQIGDYCRLQLDYDSASIKKASKIGYWGKDIYKVIEIVKSRKFNNTPSYKIEDISSNRTLPGRFARWQILPIPPPQSMKKMPEVQNNPGPDEDGSYEVESILGKKTTRKGVIAYKVKWLGWKKTTWEPEDNLSNSRVLVENYNRIHG